MTADPSIYSAQLKRNPILEGLTVSEINELVAQSEIKTFQKGSYFVHEGDASREMYIILEGSVTLEKYDQSQSLKHKLSELNKGDCFGEVSFATEESKRLCDVVANETTVAMVLERGHITKQKILNKILDNITALLSTKLNKSNDSYVLNLEHQISLLKRSVHFGRLFLVITFALGFSSIFIQVMTEYDTGINVNTAEAGWVYLIALMLPILYVIWKNPEPISSYGITKVNFKNSFVESTILIIIIAPILIWSLGHSFKQTILLFLSPMALNYLVHSGLQEFVARGVLQTTLLKLFANSNPFLSILLAAFLFAIFHLQYGLNAVFFTFISGLLFGYVFYRQKNLVGAWMIHFVLGWIALGNLI